LTQTRKAARLVAILLAHACPGAAAASAPGTEGSRDPKALQESLFVDARDGVGLPAGLDPAAAALAIRSALSDAQREANLPACMEAMLAYRAFDAVPLLKPRYERLRGAPGGQDAKALKTLALLGGHEPEVSGFCRRESASLLSGEALDARAQKTGGETLAAVRDLMLTLWITGARNELAAIRKTAREATEAFLRKIENPDAVSPQDVQRNQRNLDLVHWTEAMLARMDERDRIYAETGEDRLLRLARLYLNTPELDCGDLTECVGILLVRHSQPADASLAMRQALDEQLKIENIPQSRRLLITLDAFDWIARHGTGLTDGEKKQQEGIPGELKRLGVPGY